MISFENLILVFYNRVLNTTMEATMQITQFEQHFASTFKRLTKENYNFKIPEHCTSPLYHACIMKRRFLVIWSPSLLVEIAIWTFSLQNLGGWQTLSIYGRIKFHVILSPIIWHSKHSWFICKSSINSRDLLMASSMLMAGSMHTRHKVTKSRIISFSYQDVFLFAHSYVWWPCVNDVRPPSSLNQWENLESDGHSRWSPHCSWGFSVTY